MTPDEIEAAGRMAVAAMPDEALIVGIRMLIRGVRAGAPVNLEALLTATHELTRRLERATGCSSALGAVHAEIAPAYDEIVGPLIAARQMADGPDGDAVSRQMLDAMPDPILVGAAFSTAEALRARQVDNRRAVAVMLDVLCERFAPADVLEAARAESAKVQAALDRDRQRAQRGRS